MEIWSTLYGDQHRMGYAILDLNFGIGMVGNNLLDGLVDGSIESSRTK